MGRFDKGVSYYTTAEVTIEVSFPEDEIKCKWCPLLKHYDSIDRDRCQLTDEILVSREIIGSRCPLVIRKMNELKGAEENESNV